MEAVASPPPGYATGGSNGVRKRNSQGFEIFTFFSKIKQYKAYFGLNF